MIDYLTTEQTTKSVATEPLFVKAVGDSLQSTDTSYEIERMSTKSDIRKLCAGTVKRQRETSKWQWLQD